jgi:hypothetical protein
MSPYLAGLMAALYGALCVFTGTALFRAALNERDPDVLLRTIIIGMILIGPGILLRWSLI